MGKVSTAFAQCEVKGAKSPHFIQKMGRNVAKHRKQRSAQLRFTSHFRSPAAARAELVTGSRSRY